LGAPPLVRRARRAAAGGGPDERDARRGPLPEPLDPRLDGARHPDRPGPSLRRQHLLPGAEHHRRLGEHAGPPAGHRAGAGGERPLAGLAAALALQALACLYLGYFAFVAVPVYALVRLARAPAEKARAAAGLAAGFAAGALVALPVALPYLHARAEHVIPTQEVGAVAAFRWQPPTYPRPAVLPGVLASVPVAVL